jgi:hypothetical protein
MKLLVGTVTGIVLAVGGVAAASTPSTVTPQHKFHKFTAQHKFHKFTAQSLTGELSRKDTGAFELKVVGRQNGVLVDRDLRLLIAHATVTNRLGRIVRLPLDDATARVTGVMLPRSAWRLDDDGQLIPTFAAKRVVVIANTSRDQTDESDQTEG